MSFHYWSMQKYKKIIIAVYRKCYSTFNWYTSTVREGMRSPSPATP